MHLKNQLSVVHGDVPEHTRRGGSGTYFGLASSGVEQAKLRKPWPWTGLLQQEPWKQWNRPAGAVVPTAAQGHPRAVLQGRGRLREEEP